MAEKVKVSGYKREAHTRKAATVKEHKRAGGKVAAARVEGYTRDAPKAKARPKAKAKAKAGKSKNGKGKQGKLL